MENGLMEDTLDLDVSSDMTNELLAIWQTSCQQQPYAPSVASEKLWSSTRVVPTITIQSRQNYVTTTM